MARLNIHDLENWQTLARLSGYRASTFCIVTKISPRQLHRYTRLVFSLSPQAWLNEQRLLRAPEMLARDRLVKTVAFDLGFKQTTHFTRVFKLRFGLSPTRFLALRGTSNLDEQSNPVFKRVPKLTVSEMAATDSKWPP
jgi:AraC-like DNA-binding protein